MRHHSDLKGGLFGDAAIIVAPCPLADAQRLVVALHRHHGPVVGHKFSIKASTIDRMCVREEGVAIIGRPVSRHLDDGRTLEVTRLATRSTPNIASKLLAAAAREARRRGYLRLITYTLASEPGVSLLAAGYEVDAHSPGGSWNVPSRPRIDKHPTEPKTRWVRWLRRR
jgi:hypothetical protein